jgi:hypothetical protein
VVRRILIVLVIFRATAAAAEVCGDANRNGVLDVGDGVQILRAAAELPSVCTVAVCDADGSGAISVADGVLVLRSAAGLPAAVSCGIMDWSSAFIAVWSLDEESNGTTAVTRRATSGWCGRECDLTDVNTTRSDAGSKREGARAARFARANDERLECANLTCDELRPAGGTSFTIGCWSRLIFDDGTFRVMMNMRGDADKSGYFFGRDAAGRAVCAVQNGDTVSALSHGSAFPVGSFVHALCTFDNTADRIQTWIDGKASGAPAIQTDITAPAGSFELSTDVVGNDWDGQLDECFVAGFVLDAVEICRICSCGIDGSLCRCGAVPNYASTGRNSSECGSCDLPACNAPPPSG